MPVIYGDSRDLSPLGPLVGRDRAAGPAGHQAASGKPIRQHLIVRETQTLDIDARLLTMQLQDLTRRAQHAPSVTKVTSMLVL